MTCCLKTIIIILLFFLCNNKRSIIFFVAGYDDTTIINYPIIRINRETNTVAVITNTNTNTNGKEYSLDDVTPTIDVVSVNATYMHNGEYIPLEESPLLSYSTMPIISFVGVNNNDGGNSIILLQKNIHNDEIINISIIDGSSSDSSSSDSDSSSSGYYQSSHLIEPDVFATTREKNSKNFDHHNNRNLVFAGGYYDDKAAAVSSTPKDKTAQKTTVQTTNNENKINPPKQGEKRNLQTTTCTEYRVFETGLMYDTTFCQAAGGTKALADQEARDILAGASALYEAQGVCTKLTLSNIEGYCDILLDPFATMISATQDVGCPTNPSIVTDFGDWIQSNRLPQVAAGTIQGDLFHLLINNDAVSPRGNYGCAKQDSMCNNNPVGVENMAFTDQFWDTERFRRSAILAHEIGHNFGTNHVAPPPNTVQENYIMDRDGIGFEQHIWEQTNLDVLYQNIPTYSCGTVQTAGGGTGTGTGTTTTSAPTTVAPTPVPVTTTTTPAPVVTTTTTTTPLPTPSPTPVVITTPNPATSSSPGPTNFIIDNGNNIYNPGGRFLIKSTFNDLCVNVPQSNTVNNPVLRMFTCHGKTNQQWEMDSLGHIHSALDYNKCIGLPGPSTRPRTPPGTKLKLYDCISGEITQLWYWNANGRKLKSQWRRMRCLAVIANHGRGSATRVQQCGRGLSTQWWEASTAQIAVPTTPSPAPTTMAPVTPPPTPKPTTPLPTPAPIPTVTIADNGNDLYNPGGAFLIKSTFNDLCVNIPQSQTSGDPVLRMFRCHGKTNQLWQMDTLGHIHSVLDYNKCIGLPGPSTISSTPPGTKLRLYTCNVGEITQLWYWNANGLKLKSQWRQNRCLSVVADQGKGSAARVEQCGRGLSTQWWKTE